jgi:DNA-binding SARP family transcriptional activator
LGTTVLADRIVDPGTADWAPEVWLIDTASAGSDRDALEQVMGHVAADGRATVAVVLRAENFAPPGCAVIDVDENGVLSMPGLLGEQRIQAAGIDGLALARLLELFDSAGHFEVPGPMPGPEPWARGMTTAGSLIPEDLTPAAADTDADTDQGTVEGERAEPAPGGQVGQNAGGDAPEHDHELAEEEPTAVGQKADRGHVVPFRAGTSAAAMAVLSSTLALDSNLDDDLDEWFGATPKRPRIAVLGPPLVLANGPAPSGRIARFTEISVYLGLHNEVDADKLVTDLWPEDSHISPVTRRSDISRVRAWLGVDENGRKYLPEARHKPYRLTRLLDLDLFRRLRKRGDARAAAGDPVGAQRDLLAALTLVRGPVMSETTHDAYSWLATSDPAGVQHAPLIVIATAHQLVEIAFEEGDLDLARMAADTAYRVDPTEDLPQCDLIRIAHRAGDDLTALMWARQLLATNGVEIPADLPNYESFQVVDGIFPGGLRAAAAAASG